MSSERASLFGQDADMDLSDFKPKSPARPEQVRDVAEQAGFRSREGTKQAVESEALRREPRRYRTGRNVQLNLKSGKRQWTPSTSWRTSMAGCLAKPLSMPSMPLGVSFRKRSGSLRGANW